VRAALVYQVDTLALSKDKKKLHATGLSSHFNHE